MTKIHHATAKRAKDMGVILSEKQEDGTTVFHAHYTKNNIRMSGENAKLLLDEMVAAIDMKHNYRSFKWKEEDDGQKTVSWKGHACTSDYLHNAFATVKKAWQEAMAEQGEGEEGEDEYEGADADDDTDVGGSVVSPHYRAKYAEAGHPTHCGDWLATTLNDLCQNEKGTNVEYFESICKANGVDMGKYDRTSHGWQGRFRMTGRNLLARQVYMNGGVLKVPGQEDKKATKEWMDSKKYKADKKKGKKAA